MEKPPTGNHVSDLRQRLKKLTGNFQNHNTRTQMLNLRLHLKVLKCLDDLETTMQYSNYSPIVS